VFFSLFLVAGDSAGGNMAATVSQKLRDDKFEPKVKNQVLIYPATQFLDFRMPSHQQNANSPILKRSHMGYFTSMYLFGNKTHQDVFTASRHVPKDIQEAVRASYINYDWLPKQFRDQSPYTDAGIIEGDLKIWNAIKDAVMNPYMSPLLAKDLGNLPKAFLITCQYDVLRDEGYLYAQRMREFGTEVTYKNYESGFHGMLSFDNIIEEGAELVQDVLDYLKKEL
jgi:acetyl esterase/lipase